jgi:hypothetical protein
VSRVSVEKKSLLRFYAHPVRTGCVVLGFKEGGSNSYAQHVRNDVI